MILSLIGAALATSSFDATVYDTTFTGEKASTQDGTIPLWSVIERHVDPDTALFAQEEFNESTAWYDSDWTPWIATMFGTATPDSGTFLLHVGAHGPYTEGTPILFVPGAGDNASRGFIAMATKMDQIQRPVYALTLPQTHGDMFMQAELVADAIARIKERTGASQVDLVGHSKGGIAAAIYASHHSGAAWEDEAYNSVGTEYRGDIRRLVLIATPLAGVDMLYRWSANNYASLDAELAISPSSWTTYYPYTTGAPGVKTDLSAQDMHPQDGDLFPGQRQLLARQPHPLPGTLSWLGPYSLQQDWYTTYEGGLGYYSYSEGIDAAIEDGGHLIDRLAETGVDPDIEIFLLAGENPLLHSGVEYLWADMFGDAWVDMATAGADDWAALLAEAVGENLESFGLTDDEVRGLAQGKLILGEITGPSDGVVFSTSATYGDALTGRGATIVETKVVNLSHLDLLYASPITGQILIDAGEADPTEDGWQRAVGQRYVEADTLGWVEEILADEASAGDTGDTGSDDTGPGADDTGEDSEEPDLPSGWGCGQGCASGGPDSGPNGGWALAGVGLLLLRRR